MEPFLYPKKDKKVESGLGNAIIRTRRFKVQVRGSVSDGMDARYKCVDFTWEGK